MWCTERPVKINRKFSAALASDRAFIERQVRYAKAFTPCSVRRSNQEES